MTLDKMIEEYLKAVAEFAAAEVEEAELFMRAKMADERCTDGRAERMAKIDTHNASVLAAAKVIVARMRMERAARGVVDEPRMN